MYDLVAYGSMIADAGRTSAYARALERLVTPGAVVLDIGTGPGIMAFLACRAGASRVYAIEPAGVIDVAREAAAANGFAERIQFIQALSTDVDLPERVDGIVAEIHGVLPVYRQSAASIIDARERFLKPGGWIVPLRETMWAAVVSSPAAHASVTGAWTTRYGFDFSHARDRAASQPRRRQFETSELITAPQCWTTLDYRSLSRPSIAGRISAVVERPGPGHGLAVWFDSETATDIGYSNSPCSTEDHIFGQLFFAWPQATVLSAGDVVRVELRADLVGDDYVWTWKTDVDGPAGGNRDSYKQSSLFAELLGPEGLRKRSPSFVADLNDDGRIDRHILDLMNRGMALGDIAREILRAFPSDFKDWDEALGRVGGLSNRYCS